MTIDYSTLGAGTHTFTVIATDSDTDSISDEFVLEVLNYSSQLNNRTLSANATLTGTTLDDAIIGNTFSATELDNVYLDGGDGNDTISVNILTASFHMWHVTFDGGAGDDTINSNTLITSDNDFSIITFDGGAGDDTISGNTLNSSSEILSITFDGGDGNDIVSNNTLTASGNIWRITFDGGAGNDTFTGNSLTAGFAASIIIFDGGAGDDNISGNTLAADATVYSITFYGRAGEDTISGNTLYEANNVTLHGGDGNDTISGNTLTSSVSISAIVFNGGDGNDTISDNHFEATGIYRNVNSILLGGKGDDVFRNNSATQSHGVLATLTIDGGDGEDTVVFRSIADEYAGIFDWTHGVTTITLTGDGAAVILIDIETVAFADGASYSTSDAWVKGNGGILYDLANTFASTFSDHSTDSGTITGNTLTLASTELAHGANTIVITATAINNAETTETITINAVKTLKSTGAKQHDQQTLDLNAIFVDAHTYTSTQTNGASGISLNNNILSFDNTVLDEGTQFVTITASDGSDAFTHTLTYALDTIKDQTFSDGGSNSSYIGTTYADEITDNSFAETSGSLSNIYLDGGAGEDTISSNTLTASAAVWEITFDGRDGDDTISDNHFMSSGMDSSISTHYSGVHAVVLLGSAGNDTISSNTISANHDIWSSTFDGGDGDDTISGNTIITDWSVASITLHGGDGNDTISDNHFEATGTSTSSNVFSITFMGGAGDDVFRDNFATQANEESARLTIDGGAGEDTVVFRLIADEYAGISDWIDGGGMTTITLTGDGAAVTLIDVETIAFADGASYSAADAWVKGNGGILYDLAKAFAGTFTGYTTSSGTIGTGTGQGNTLTLAGTELAHGANTIVVTATDAETTETITVNAVKTLRIAGAKQHDQQMIDLNAIFVDAHTYTYTSAQTSGGISLNNSTLSFANTVLSEGAQAITITATDGSDVFTHTLTYALDTIKGQTVSDGGSNTTYTGTALTDTITDNSFAETNGSITNVDWDGGAGDDTISGNTLIANDGVSSITFDGGDGNDTISDNHLNSTGTDYYSAVDASTFMGGAGDDTISGNTLIANDDVSSITFDGGTGNDTISNNTLTASNSSVRLITFDGGDGDDTISNNTLTASNSSVRLITFDGGDGNDAISDNTLTASNSISSITFDGDDGDDTISGNTLSGKSLGEITFDGGAGDDTISDNHLNSTGTDYYSVVYTSTFMGGAGDDLFRDNTASQANGESARLTIDGGAGEDTVVFRLIADEYAGISDWIDGGGITTITLTGDGAAVTLIDVETIAFADGASYSAADAGVEGNGGILYDLAKAFSGTFTGYTTSSGTITSNTLTLAGTELAHGANTIVVTATASDSYSTKTTETITVNTVKTLRIAGAKQHDQQMIDLNAIFVDAHTYTYTSAQTSGGISLNNSTLSFANTVLSEGAQAITITATDGSDVFTHTLTYALDTIKGQTVSDGGSNTTYTGTALTDTITDNSFAETNGSIKNVDWDGGAGDDIISSNTLTATSGRVSSITFDGGAGDDTISGNTFAGGSALSITFHGGRGNDTISGNNLTVYDIYNVSFHGGDGNDTINNNTLTARGNIASITFVGGDGNDTISSNTLMTGLGVNDSIRVITFDGGDGDDTISNNTFTANSYIYDVTLNGGDGGDTISDNHLVATGARNSHDVYSVTFMGGAGDDVFRDNTATQANGERAKITIDGGADTDGLDTDKVYFELASSMFTITGNYNSNITVTDIAKRTNAGDGNDVNSYAEYVLIDIEELYFDDTPYVFS